MKQYPLFTLISLLTISIQALGQSIPAEAKQQGFHWEDEILTFVFDPALYEITPDRVVVTGSFRNWDQDMAATQWTLSKNEDLWTLKVENSNLEKVPAQSEFKFRINGGEWLNPPAQTPNERGGNLVFLQNYEVPTLVADLGGSNTIWATITGERPLEPTAYYISSVAAIGST